MKKLSVIVVRAAQSTCSMHVNFYMLNRISALKINNNEWKGNKYFSIIHSVILSKRKVRIWKLWYIIRMWTDDVVLMECMRQWWWWCLQLQRQSDGTLCYG